MKIELLENTQEIRHQFIKSFIMSWDEFLRKQKNWISDMAKRNYVIDMDWYTQAYLWDKMDPGFPLLSFSEALALLRKHNGAVLFMSEDESHHYPGELFFNNEVIRNFVARADAKDLAALIEDEWFESYKLAEQHMYNPNPVLPVDLYVFDSSIKWCIVFTHETTDWESELDDPMKAAASRYCITVSCP